MKFNKTVLAVAIAGIAAAPMMASATTTLSGAVQLQLAGSDSEAPHSNLNGEGGFEDGEARIKTGDVIVGVNASQAMNNGLTGYGALRIDLDTFSTGDVGTADNVYVGIKGGFGDFRVGEVANPGEYGQVADIVNDMGTTINQGFGYVGSFGGATVGASYSPATNHDLFAVGAKFGWNGLSLGVGMQNEDEKTNVSAMVGFSYAGASISLGFAQVEDGFTVTAPVAAVAADPANGVLAVAGVEGEFDDETAIAAKVGYAIAGVSLNLTYQAEQESEDTVVRLDAAYGLGGGMEISTRISALSGADDSADDTQWRIQLAKSF